MNSDSEQATQVLVPARTKGAASGVYIMSLVAHLFSEAQEPDGKSFESLFNAIGAEVFTACNGWPEPGLVTYRWAAEMPEVLGAAWRAYQEAFDEHAGPQHLRHGCNYDKYHRAGLAGVVNYMNNVRAA